MNEILGLLTIIFEILGRDKMKKIHVMYSKKIDQSFFSLLKDSHEGVLVIKDDWPLSKDELEALAFYSYLGLKHVENPNNTKKNLKRDVRLYEDPIHREAATFATIFMYKLTSLMLTRHKYKDLVYTNSVYAKPFDITGQGLPKNEEREMQEFFNIAYECMKEKYMPEMNQYDDVLLAWLEAVKLV